MPKRKKPQTIAEGRPSRALSKEEKLRREAMRKDLKANWFDIACYLYENSDATMVEILAGLHVARNTFYEYMRKNPGAFERYMQAKHRRMELRADEIRDGALNGLKKLVEGYDATETREAYDIDEEGNEIPKAKTVTTKHIPPATAAVLWALSNTAPDKFKNDFWEKVRGNREGKEAPEVILQLIEQQHDEDINEETIESDKEKTGRND